jgi:GTPase
MANNRMSCLVERGGGTLTVPIFHVSSVSGMGLALLHAFLRALPTGTF